MSLLEKAKVVTTPTAYSDGFLHSVKPNVVLGDELVVNGSFDTDSDWTLSSGSTISGGSLNIIAAPYNANTRQNIPLVSGKTYKVIIEATAIGSATDNTFQLGFGDASGNPSDATQYEFEVGYSVKTFTITASATDATIIFRSRDAGTSNLSIHNVSVKEKLDADFTFTRNSSATRVGEDGYIQDIATDLPRINYEGFQYDNGLPIYGSGKGHLLLEGQSTNLRELSNTYVGDAKIRGTISNDASAVSPSGSLGVEYLTATGTNGLVLDSSFLTGDGTFSVYLKRKTGVGDIRMSINGGVDYTTMAVTDVWKRFSLSSTTGLGQLVISCLTSGDEVYIWGWQEEALSYPTSYIPTNGSAVTRAAETCNNAGNADLFDSEGVLYADIKPDVDFTTYSLISISDGTTVNNVVLGKSINTGKYYTTLKSGGANQFSYDFAVDDVYNKIAIRYKENDFSVWLNGVQVHTDTSGLEPIGLNQLAFDFGGGSLPFYGKTKMVAVFPYLSNDEMECLTSEGYGSFQAMALANNYTIIQG